jgi:hypothetical protein
LANRQTCSMLIEKALDEQIIFEQTASAAPAQLAE